MTSAEKPSFDAREWTEAMFLTAFSCYVIFFYLQTTTFSLAVPGFVYSVIRGVLLLCGLYRLYSWRSEVSPVTGTALAALMGLGIFYFVTRGDTMVLDAALMMAGAYKVSFKKIGIIYVFLGSFISLLALICSQTGIIADYTFLTNYGGEEHLRHSFGIIYPTDFLAHITFLTAVYFIVRWKRVTYLEIVCAGVILGISYYFTSARADMAGAVCMLILMLICKFAGFRELQVAPKVKAVLLSAFMPLCAVFAVILTYLYDPQNPFMYRLDSIMSYRLSLGKTGMDLIKYLYKYGIVLLLVMFLVYALIALRLSTSKMLYAMVFIGVITASFIIEHHMLELSYNITLLVLTADISTILQSGSYINIKKKNGIIT